MGNISSTKEPRSFAGVRVSTLLIALALAIALGFAVWAGRTLVVLSHKRIVTVRLSALMGAFVEAEARKGTDPDTAHRDVTAYLAAVSHAVDQLGKDGTTVLVAEAVVAGSAQDVTEALRAKVAANLAREEQRHDK